MNKDVYNELFSYLVYDTRNWYSFLNVNKLFYTIWKSHSFVNRYIIEKYDYIIYKCIKVNNFTFIKRYLERKEINNTNWFLYILYCIDCNSIESLIGISSNKLIWSNFQDRLEKKNYRNLLRRCGPKEDTFHCLYKLLNVKKGYNILLRLCMENDFYDLFKLIHKENIDFIDNNYIFSFSIKNNKEYFVKYILEYNSLKESFLNNTYQYEYICEISCSKLLKLLFQSNVWKTCSKQRFYLEKGSNTFITFYCKYTNNPFVNDDILSKKIKDCWNPFILKEYSKKIEYKQTISILLYFIKTTLIVCSSFLLVTFLLLTTVITISSNIK